MDTQWQLDDRERIFQLRRMSTKLAKNQSRKRAIRKLPQTIFIVPRPKPSKTVWVRDSINRNKRLTYILLLGLSLIAFVYDIDPVALQEIAGGQVDVLSGVSRGSRS